MSTGSVGVKQAPARGARAPSLRRSWKALLRSRRTHVVRAAAAAVKLAPTDCQGHENGLQRRAHDGPHQYERAGPRRQQNGAQQQKQRAASPPNKPEGQLDGGGGGLHTGGGAEASGA